MLYNFFLGHWEFSRNMFRKPGAFLDHFSPKMKNLNIPWNAFWDKGFLYHFCAFHRINLRRVYQKSCFPSYFMGLCVVGPKINPIPCLHAYSPFLTFLRIQLDKHNLMLSELFITSCFPRIMYFEHKMIQELPRNVPRRNVQCPRK